jgi:cyanate lyase
MKNETNEEQSIQEQLIVKKCEKDYPDFVNSHNTLGPKELEASLLIYAKHREDSEMAKKIDKDLNKAKEAVKELSAPYNDAIKALKLKTAFLHMLIQERKSGKEDETK